MKLLWQGAWLDAPAYGSQPGGELVRVDATVPLAAVPNPTARVIRNPYRKAWRALLAEGPRSTWRKARAIRESVRLQGDYRVVAARGRRMSDGAAVLALCCRVPPCAQVLPAHPRLMVPVAADQPGDALERFAARVAERCGPDVGALGHQRYLYSGIEPPAELVSAVSDAASPRAPGGGGEVAPSAKAIVPPAEPADPEPSLALPTTRARPGRLPVAVLGAGQYARTEVIPMLSPRFRRLVVADREPQVAAHTARSRRFEIAVSDAGAAIELLPAPGLVIVATAHDSHAELAARALEGGHRVFLEKPAVVTAADLTRLLDAASRAPGRLELGFNRRHHPLVGRLRRLLAAESGPLTITCVVREIPLSPEHWYFWPNQGTRVAGNLCHWIDLGVFLVPEADPVAVSMSPPAAAGSPPDSDRALTVSFADGSILTLVATDRGDAVRGVQETIDVRRGDLTARLDDLRSLAVLRRGRRRTRRRLPATRGHRQMFRASLARIDRDEPAAYPLRDLAATSVVQLAATSLVPEGGTVRVDASSLPR